MYQDDAPVLELSSTDKTSFKEAVDSTLFQEFKFNSSWQEVNHIMGYIFHKNYKDKNICSLPQKSNLGYRV